MNRTVCALTTAAALGAATFFSSGVALAEGPVSPTGKGIVGGALLGGEVIILAMGAIGVESGWAYLGLGTLGAAGGGVGGFFIEDSVNADDAEAPVYMLAGGMALFIPTLIVALNATSYNPPESDSDQSVTMQPSASAPVAAETVKVAAAPVAPARHVPTSVVDVHAGDLALGVPAVQIRPLYSRRELAIYNVAQSEEVRVPVFTAAF